MNKKTAIYQKLTFFTLLILTIAGVIFVYTKKPKIIQEIKTTPILGQQIFNPTPTPTVPFYELTIPYLKNRTYQSKLGELKLQSQNSLYTSYLTSYDSDGFNINGLLTIPSGTPPPGGWPAVVFVHGYIPPTLYRTQEKYTDHVNYLARNGLVVFKIDLRGHGSSQGEPGGGYYSSDYVIDTLNAHAALKNLDNVNDQKIGLWGHSMAGNITFRSFIASEVQKIVVWGGAGFTYSDLSQFRISDSSYRAPSPDSEASVKRRQLSEAHGSFNPESDFWKQVTPVNYLDGKTGSIQLHHATDDTVVRIDYSRNLIKVLEGTDIDSQLFEYPTGGHNITGNSFNAAMQRTVDFFKN